MILKRLFEEDLIIIEKLLHKFYRKLSLSLKEVAVLIVLFSIYQKRKTFSVLALARRVDLSSNEIGEIVESLLNKGLLTLSLEQKDGREREIFDLTPTFIQIEELIIAENKEKQKMQIQTEISQIIQTFEQHLGRPLKSFELDNIRQWFHDQNYSYDQIIQAINQSEQRVSIKHVEKILSQEPITPLEIPDEVDKVLDEIYKGIK